jgi:putative flippase GtrA
MKPQIKDAKSKSASEAFVNSFGSYPIGYILGIVILPFSMTWLQDDLLVANLFVTLIYATVSFVRTYYLRRAFTRLGVDDNFIKLGVKVLNKIKRQTKS